MKKIKLYKILSLVSLMSLSGCNNTSNTDSGKQDNSSNSSRPIETSLPDLKYTGDLDIVCYIEGQNGIVVDIGNPETKTQVLMDSALARIAAPAKEFKKVYPNINVNVYYGNIGDYYDRVYAYKEAKGHLPHIMHTIDAPHESINNGFAADVSQYKYMTYYQAIGEQFWDYVSVGDFVSSVPFMIYPTGIFVNVDKLQKEFLIDDNILEDWTVENMISMAKDVFEPGINGGLGFMPTDMLNNIIPSIHRSLINERKVSLNNPEVIRALELENELAKYSTYSYETNAILESFPDIHTYSWNENFIDGAYTMEMTRPYCYQLYGKMATLAGKDEDFDFLPFPKFENYDNYTVGAIVEGYVIGNQCPIGFDGEVNCSNNDKLAQEAAAAFAMFSAVDTNAYRALSNVEWTIYNSPIIGVNDFPVIKKGYKFPYNTTDEDEYTIQMGYYNQTYSYWSDKPGFKEVIRIFTEEPENTLAYNTIPRTVPIGITETRDILNGWNGRYRGDVAVGSSTWVSYITSKLATWEEECNSTIDTAYDLLQENMDTYYGVGKYNVYAE